MPDSVGGRLRQYQIAGARNTRRARRAPLYRSRNRLFNKQYLSGFKRVGDTIEGNFNADILNREFAAECVNCGAKFTYKRGEKARCPYCGSPVATDGSGVIPY